MACRASYRRQRSLLNASRGSLACERGAPEGLGRRRTAHPEQPPLAARHRPAVSGQLHLRMRHTNRALGRARRPGMAGGAPGPRTAEGLAGHLTAHDAARREVPPAAAGQLPAHADHAVALGRAAAAIGTEAKSTATWTPQGWRSAERHVPQRRGPVVAGQLRLRIRPTRTRSGEPGGQARREERGGGRRRTCGAPGVVTRAGADNQGKQRGSVCAGPIRVAIAYATPAAEGLDCRGPGSAIGD
jgi:hypothetical protein